MQEELAWLLKYRMEVKIYLAKLAKCAWKKYKIQYGQVQNTASMQLIIPIQIKDRECQVMPGFCV